MPEKRTIERAKKAEQAIAIGLSQARKAGVELPPPPGKKKKKSERKHRQSTQTSASRARATLKALRKEPQSTVSPEKLAEHTRKVAKRRGPIQRRKAALKAVRTKGKVGPHRAAEKAAETRRQHAH